MAIAVAGRGSEVVGVYAFFTALATVAVALRVYCRVVLVKNLALDDYFAVCAWVFWVTFAGFAINGAHHGTGQHASDIKPPSEIPVGLKWWWVCEPIYVIANLSIKWSIAVMLLRLTVDRTHRLIIWCTLIVTTIFSMFFFFLFINQCQPASYFWTQYTGATGKCINPQITVNVTYAYSALTCVGDWILAILPFFLVWKLQMEKRQKYLVALILAMGAVASTATIIRIPYLPSLSNKDDFLYATVDVAIWSACETGIGITAASAATLRPLFRQFNFLNATSVHNGYGLPSTANRRPGLSGHRQSLNRWPSGASAGYVRSHSRGTASAGGGAAEELGQQHSAEDRKIRQTTSVTISEDYGYTHRDHIVGQYSAGGESPTSQTGITGGATKKTKNDVDEDVLGALPDVSQQSRFCKGWGRRG